MQAPGVADACETAAYLSSSNGGFSYPTTDGRAIYSVTYNGTVTAFSANSGALIWKMILPEAAQTTIEASSTTTSTSSSQANVTRTITVTVNQGVIGDNTPPLAGGKLFVTTRDGHVYALNATNGKQVWSTSLGATIYDPRASSAVGYGKIFLGTSKGLLAVSTSDGSVAWRAQLGSAYAWTPTVVDKTVFIADDNGTLYQFDANNGALLWHFSGLGRGWVSEPIVADGLIVIDANNGVFAFH
jgi:glucose dehydrogenase